jgi:hypothetical protein
LEREAYERGRLAGYRAGLEAAAQLADAWSKREDYQFVGARNAFKMTAIAVRDLPVPAPAR